MKYIKPISHISSLLAVLLVRTHLRNLCALSLLVSAFVTTNANAAGPSPRCAIPAGTAPFEFTADGNVLRGFIDVPAGTGMHPAIMIVHGSGTTNVSQGEGIYSGSYEEMRAAFRAVGIATVVWDKAGNGCSEGHYLHADDVYGRASEVVSAVKALRKRDDIDASRIGAWGISQGGWIAPIAAVRSPSI
jgi:poly(3-hydroxybutyrate) depolymerase